MNFVKKALTWSFPVAENRWEITPVEKALRSLSVCWVRT